MQTYSSICKTHRKSLVFFWWESLKKWNSQKHILSGGLKGRRQGLRNTAADMSWFFWNLRFFSGERRPNVRWKNMGKKKMKLQLCLKLQAALSGMLLCTFAKRLGQPGSFPESCLGYGCGFWKQTKSVLSSNLKRLQILYSQLFVFKLLTWTSLGPGANRPLEDQG